MRNMTRYSVMKARLIRIKFISRRKKSLTFEVNDGFVADDDVNNKDKKVNNNKINNNKIDAEIELTPIRKFDAENPKEEIHPNGAISKQNGHVNHNLGSDEDEVESVTSKENGTVTFSIANGEAKKDADKDTEDKTDNNDDDDAKNEEGKKKPDGTPPSPRGPSPAFFRMLLKTFFGSMLRNALIRAFVVLFELVQPSVLGRQRE